MLTLGSTEDGVLTDSDREAIETALMGHSFAHAFHGTYVVALTYDIEREELGEALREVMERAPHLSYLMSPEIEGGTYSGWLPGDRWAHINRRSEGEHGPGPATSVIDV